MAYCDCHLTDSKHTNVSNNYRVTIEQTGIFGIVKHQKVPYNTVMYTPIRQTNQNTHWAYTYTLGVATVSCLKHQEGIHVEPNQSTLWDRIYLFITRSSEVTGCLINVTAHASQCPSKKVRLLMSFDFVPQTAVQVTIMQQVVPDDTYYKLYAVVCSKSSYDT